jgi:hypothetical protein
VSDVTERKKLVKRTIWFAGYKAAAKAQMRLACQAFDGTVEIICLKGGLVTDVEQEEMDTIIADGITDAKKSGVECRIEKKVMGFYSFVQEYGEPYGVTVESLLAQTSADSGLVQEHGTPEPQPELAVARSGDQPCQPTVPEGTPPSLASPVAARADDVDAWLEEAGLGKYADAIKEYGYDTIAALQFATEEDIVEMSEDSDVGMKKPHRRLLVGKWHELTA